MMVTAAEQWRAEGRAWGLAESRAEALADALIDGMPHGQRVKSIIKQQWLAQGRTAGKSEVLKQILEQRFGPLSPETHGFIDNASPRMIDAWVDCVFKVKSLQEFYRVGVTC